MIYITFIKLQLHHYQGLITVQMYLNALHNRNGIKVFLVYIMLARQYTLILFLK